MILRTGARYGTLEDFVDNPWDEHTLICHEVYGSFEEARRGLVGVGEFSWVAVVAADQGVR